MSTVRSHDPDQDQEHAGAGDIDAQAVSISSATGLPLPQCELLMQEARGDFNLAIARGFKKSIAVDRGAVQPPPKQQRATLTVLGGEIQYSRSSARLLSQHIFLVVELLGEKRRTEPVRRSKHPRWTNSYFDVILPATDELERRGSERVSLSLCDLDNNVLGSGCCEFRDFSASGVAAVQLLATCDLEEQCSACAGTIQLTMAIPLEDVVQSVHGEDSLTRNQSCPVQTVYPTCTAEMLARRMLPVQHEQRLSQWRKCVGCHSPYLSTELVTLGGCGHATCEPCLANCVRQAMSKGQGMTGQLCVACPKSECIASVETEEIYRALPSAHPVLVDLAEQSLDDTLTREMSAGTTMVSCPQCASSFGMKPGTVGELTASAQDKMKAASPAALAHFATHRVRCPECDLEFCNSCLATPFHVGADNCEAVQSVQEAAQCRFCCKELDPNEAIKTNWWLATRTGDTEAWRSSAGTHRGKQTTASNVLADSKDCWCSVTNENEWLTFDLMESLEVTRVKINAGNSPRSLSSRAEVPRRVSIQQSVDSQHGPWHTVAALDLEQSTEPQSFSLVPPKACGPQDLADGAPGTAVEPDKINPQSPWFKITCGSRAYYCTAENKPQVHSLISPTVGICKICDVLGPDSQMSPDDFDDLLIRAGKTDRGELNAQSDWGRFSCEGSPERTFYLNFETDQRTLRAPEEGCSEERELSPADFESHFSVVQECDAEKGGEARAGAARELTAVHNRPARFWRLWFHDNYGGSVIRIQHAQFEVVAPALQRVCGAEDCQARASNACVRTLSCGHACCGVRCDPTQSCEDVCVRACLHCAAQGVSVAQYERQCMNHIVREQRDSTDGLSPTVEEAVDCCTKAYSQLVNSETTADQYCSLCYTEPLGAAPVLQLGCGHVLHHHCLTQQLTQRWSGSRISFNFLECAVCRSDLRHPQLDSLIAPDIKLRDKVTKLAVEELVRNEGADGAQALADTAGEQLGRFARRKFVFKSCFECKQPFCVGARDCGGDEAEAADAEEAAEEAVCQSCLSQRTQVQACDRHGTQHLTWKCRYCCQVATFECFKYAHFCSHCHESNTLQTLIDFKTKKQGPLPYCQYPGQQYVNKKELGEYEHCPGCDDGGASCPLGVLHPRNGSEFCLGCEECRTERAVSAPLLTQIRAMVGEELMGGYMVRIQDDRNIKAVRVEHSACMLQHGEAALAEGKLSQQDAVDWLENNGHTKWSTVPTDEEKRVAVLEGLLQRGPQLRVYQGFGFSFACMKEEKARDDSLDGREIVFCQAPFGPRINVTAPLQLAEISTEKDSAAELDLTGKVCVVNRGGLTFVRKALIAQSAGAVALIIVNNESGSLHMGGDGNEEDVKIPVVSVEMREADSLAVAAAVGRPATLNLKRHDGRPTALPKRQPPLHEVIDAFRCLELSPALTAIRDRPERSAVRMQAWARRGARRQHFLMLRSAALEIQRITRGFLLRLSRRPTRLRLQRIKQLEEAQFKRRAALAEQTRRVTVLEREVSRREALRLEIPEKAAALSSADSEAQLGLCTWFRKLLSFPAPPIDEVIRSGIVPLFVELLDPTYGKPKPSSQSKSATPPAPALSFDKERVSRESGDALRISFDHMTGKSDSCFRFDPSKLNGMGTSQNSDPHVERELPTIMPAADGSDSRIPKDDDRTVQVELVGLEKPPGAKQIAEFSAAERKEIVQQFYAKHNPAKPEAEIDMVLAKPKYMQDFGKMCRLLEKKYNENPVTLWWAAKHCGGRAAAPASAPAVAAPIPARAPAPTSAAAVQFEAAWVLTNIASGNAEHTAQVIDNGAVPIFVQLLSSPNDNVREQAVWALGNIAGDSPRCRDLVLQSQVLTPLLAQLAESSRVSMLRNATWTLSNLCRGKPQPPFEMVKPALPRLAHLICSNDEEVLTDACWALSYLSDGTNDTIQAVIDAGVVRRLVELLGHWSSSVQTPTLRTIGNIVTGHNLQTQIVIDSGALPCLLRLLNSRKESIRKEACWTISNITAGSKDQIQNVIDCGLVPPLVQLLAMARVDVKKEAAFAISNATSGGTPEQIRYLVTQQCIRPLCDLLAVQDNNRIINVALVGIENILKLGQDDKDKSGAEVNDFCRLVEEADGMGKLKTLQSHANDEIQGRAVKILKTYFGI